MAREKRKVSVPRLQVVVFTRQLASMLSSGIPMITALGVLREQPECPELGEVIDEIQEMVNSGIRLSVAMNEYPRVFSRIYTVMIQIGEQTGQLEELLDRLSEWLERDESLRQRIMKALSYPAFVTVLAIVLTMVLFYTVVPNFLNIFVEMGAELPLITRVVKAIADGLRSPGCWLCGLAVGCSLYYWTRNALHQPGAWKTPFRWLRRVPVVGDLLLYGALARLASTLGLLLECGTDLPNALRLSVGASGHPLWEADLEALLTSVREGQPVSEHLAARSDLYPSTLTQMLLAGEESARLAELTLRAGAYYEVELGFQIDTLASVIEPVLMAGVSIVVGSVVISLFLPLYGFLGKLGA